MDDFTGLLARDFGLKPQGKSAPMSAPPQTNSSASDYNSFASSYSFTNNASPGRKNKKSDSSSPVFDGDDLLFNDVFTDSHQPKPSAPPTFDYDGMFKDQTTAAKSSSSSSSSMPVFDKPVYDDEDVDVFEDIPELKVPSTSSQSARFENVFASSSASSLSPTKHRKQSSSPFDDLIGDLGKKETEPNKREREDKGSSFVFDDLIPGFGSTKRSTTPETSSQSQKPLYGTSKTSSSSYVEDPFVVLGESATTTTPRDEQSTGGGGFSSDPLEEIGQFNSRKTDHYGGVFVDVDPLDSLGKSSGTELNNSRGSKSHHMRAGGNMSSGSQSPAKKVSFDEVFETSSKTVHEAVSSPVYRGQNLSEHKSDGSFDDSSEDVWLTVSEIPLFTQPTSAPPPTRPPPPRPTRPVKKKVVNNESSSARASSQSQMDDFLIGRNHQTVGSGNGHVEEPSSGGEDPPDVISAAVASAAAMKDAMDKAEAKFRHAKERREKENFKASRSSREGGDNYDSREREVREKQVRLEREREEEMAKAQEREREQKIMMDKERERERLMARQAVERATREARERAANEAHAKVQRAAVEKAADARERAERAAVQRANAEARERAAAGAREKAREKAAAEAREKEAARVRAERATVERAAAEARARAAAAQAKAAKQQETNNDDLESFFNSVSRPSSAPRQRTNPPTDPFQDSWNKGGSYESSRASSRVPPGTSENLRKASSATNIVDDLSSIFGASQPGGGFGGFQDVEGETEERRRARLERHQRTQERAAKALAEKNERDLQVQRDQAERNRIGETLDVEIKRWGAGKEGNLRALLSTLQYVLWPECGWQSVSLTDLITAVSVKKVYRKATLCIHPDKVQQKGANLQQKYIAEKVFDMLKEAWNKFNSEELF